MVISCYFRFAFFLVNILHRPKPGECLARQRLPVGSETHRDLDLQHLPHRVLSAGREINGMKVIYL